MKQWYARRNFVVPMTKLGRFAQAATIEVPAEDSLFAKMWRECEGIANNVKNTKYFKGILENNLDPNAYGSLMVQDAYYCFKAQDAYAAAATHALDDFCSLFFNGKFESYADYNVYYRDTWCVREPSGVIPGKAIKEYADYEAHVCQHLESPYVFAVMLPCEYLWTWVANMLDEESPKEGLYYFWIKNNAGTPDGAYQMADALESYRSQIDEDLAIKIFRKAMEFEERVFTEATESDELFIQKI